MADVEKYAGKQRIGLLEQSGWNTPAADDANYTGLNYDSSVSIPDPGVQTGQFGWGARSGSMRESARRYTDAVSQPKMINFSGIITKGTLAPHLTAALQYVTEAATTPYAKIYHAGNVTSTGDPEMDFSNDEGYTHTIAIDNYQGYDGVILEDAVLDNLNLIWENNSSGIDRLAKMAGTWKGTAIQHGQDLSGGTWVAPLTTGFYNTASQSAAFTPSTVTIGSTSLDGICWRRFELQINNNVTSDCKTIGGKPNNWKFAPEIKMLLDIPYNETSYALFSEYVSGSDCLLTFQNGAGTADGGLSIHAGNGFLEVNPFQYENGYQVLRLTINVEYEDVVNGAFVIKMADTVQWGYPAP